MFQHQCFGPRMLLKKPGFTLIAVLTLSLGSAVYTVSLRAGDVQAREAQRQE